MLLKHERQTYKVFFKALQEANLNECERPGTMK